MRCRCTRLVALQGLPCTEHSAKPSTSTPTALAPCMADPWPEQRSQALPQLSLTKSTSTGDDDWTSPQVHRCLPAETLSLRASNVPAPASTKAPLSLPAASLSEGKPGKAPSGLQRMTSGYVEDAPSLPASSLLSTSAGALAQPSTAAATSEEYQPWAAVETGECALLCAHAEAQRCTGSPHARVCSSHVQHLPHLTRKCRCR